MYFIEFNHPIYINPQTSSLCVICFHSSVWFTGVVLNNSSIGAYGTAKKKRPWYLVGNLVATNWPIEKALHAIGYNQIPTK